MQRTSSDPNARRPIASTASIGQFAIQLTVLAGYKVVATADPQDFELLKGLGAEAVFDHHDSEVIAKVKEATDDSIRAALGTIGSLEAQSISAAVIRPTGGRVLHVHRVVPESTTRTNIVRSCACRVSF